MTSVSLNEPTEHVAALLRVDGLRAEAHLEPAPVSGFHEALNSTRSEDAAKALEKRTLTNLYSVHGVSSMRPRCACSP